MSNSTLRAYSDLGNTLLRQHPYEAAAILENADSQEVARILEEQKPQQAIPLLRALGPDSAASAVASMHPEKAARLLESAEPHQVALFLARLDEESKAGVLGDLDPAMRREVEALSAYSPDTAGGMMNPRVTAFKPSDTVGHAVRMLKNLQRRRIQDVFLVNEDSELVGAIPLQEIVFSSSDKHLEALASPPPQSCSDNSPR